MKEMKEHKFAILILSFAILMVVLALIFNERQIVININPTATGTKTEKVGETKIIGGTEEKIIIETDSELATELHDINPYISLYIIYGCG